MRGPGRGLTVLLGLLTSACAGAPPPATHASTTGNKIATPHIDGSRADAELLRHLAALPAPRPIESVVSEAARSDLEGALSAMSKDERAALERGEKRTVERHPVLALMAGSRSPAAMSAACCKGGSSRELMRIRDDRAPMDDLPASIRAIARESALIFAKAQLEAAAHGAVLTVSEADAIEQIARTLSDARLSHLARAHAASLDPSAPRLALAAAAAAQALEIQEARALLDKARHAPGGAGEALHDAERALQWAATFEQAKGENARGEQALTAAEAAMRLGRADLLPRLVAQSGAGEDDLRVAVASALGELGGELCGGLERSNEPAQLCALAWRASPAAADMLTRIEQSFAKGKGQTPWAIETYLGLHDVLPMSLAVMGTQGRGGSPLKAHLASLKGTLGKLPTPRGEALTLFVEALSQSLEAQQSPASEHTELVRRAEALIESAPHDPLSQRAAIAVAAVLAPGIDTTSLLEKLTEPSGELGGARDALLALLADRFGHDATAKAARERLTKAGDPTRLLSAELGVLADANKASLDELERTSRTIQPGDDDATQLQKACDLLGALLRQGRRAEAESVFVSMASRLGAAPQDALSRELLALFETEGHALLATSPNDVERRTAQRKLSDRVERGAGTLSPELRLYRALWLGQLAGEHASRCAHRDTACKLDAEDDARLARRTENEALRQMHPHAASLVRRGHIALGGSAQLSLSFSLESGIDVRLAVRPRLLVAPRPERARLACAQVTPAPVTARALDRLTTKPGATTEQHQVAAAPLQRRRRLVAMTACMKQRNARLLRNRRGTELPALAYVRIATKLAKALLAPLEPLTETHVHRHLAVIDDERRRRIAPWLAADEKRVQVVERVTTKGRKERLGEGRDDPMEQILCERIEA